MPPSYCHLPLPPVHNYSVIHRRKHYACAKKEHFLVAVYNGVRLFCVVITLLPVTLCNRSRIS